MGADAGTEGGEQVGVESANLENVVKGVLMKENPNAHRGTGERLGSRHVTITAPSG